MISFKEYLDEMALTRYAVVDEKGKPHFIADDEKSANRVASKTPGYTVRKIFAPRKRKDDVIPVKDIERKTNDFL